MVPSRPPKTPKILILPVMGTLHVDMVGGAAGDMLLAALLDAGAPPDQVREALAKLALPGLELLFSKEIRKFLHVQRVEVRAPAEQPHRHLSDVLRIIEGAELGPRVTTGARKAFEALARAEAAVHGTTPEEVHFHEVGAVDAIADVVGVLAALEALEIERVVVAPFPVQGGTVQADHGTLPLPAPAVLALLAEAGAPVSGRDGRGELVTPTAAALLTTLATSYGPCPSLTLRAVGYGAGRRHAPEGAPPNVVRVLVGEEPGGATPGEVVVLEAGLDDQTPEAIGYLARSLRDAGALDVFLTPVQMKKGRPGVLVTCLAAPHTAGLLEDRLLVEGSTLGVRRRREDRTVLPREVVTVDTPHGAVRVKVARRPDGRATGAPEYEDCARIARAAGAAFAEVYAAAVAAFEARA
jgi:uncharacterized protein (TIGR00299 family) protein